MKHYLKFSKKELLGLFILIIVILFFTILPFVRPRSKKELLTETNRTALNDLANTLSSSASKEDAQTGSFNQGDQQPSYAHVPLKATLFSFDPNTLNEAGWKQLGLRQRTIRTIINYRKKGGHFYKAGDLQKIYGLHPDEFERLLPYIVIPGRSLQTTGTAAPAYEKTYIRTPPQPIDINAADTTAYKSLNGIGSKLAARIVNYREKLGGFYRISQVGETYGVPDSTFRKIQPFLRLDKPDIRRLNINTAAYEALNAHPYISSKLAYLIVKQRKAAPIASPEALQALVAQTNDVFEKLEPYVQIEAAETLKH